MKLKKFAFLFLKIIEKLRSIMCLNNFSRTLLLKANKNYIEISIIVIEIYIFFKESHFAS